MRVKLQNFAKAAILAIAQQNCSIDDAWPDTKASGRGSGSTCNPRDGVPVAILQVHNCEYS
ncbi:hypothetical protein C1Y11_16715 [Pseudomonas sp. FW305-20]|nr:hypothetical protein C1Y11_16715 [Pseudomonas sp. FW305-20]PMU18662.1 hypothetical protein C1Y10_12290 [Pseudomonas sp. FW305-122]PMU40949.1 hypothetical protein C1Y12_09335 [Pseudomonas sp. FW305-47B]PMX61352.1 hypothetical protein C1Y13_12195 [Pseudomonas sp. FW305-33]PMX68987.1 hypothetical protein C1X12_09450 [Pseudomonas sp. FW305-60]